MRLVGSKAPGQKRKPKPAWALNQPPRTPGSLALGTGSTAYPTSPDTSATSTSDSRKLIDVAASGQPHGAIVDEPSGMEGVTADEETATSLSPAPIRPVNNPQRL